MSGADWWFEPRSKSAVEHDPTEADQFNSEDVKLDEALIRETTQNSQDAGRSPLEPVTVRLSHVQGAALDEALLGELTAALPPRLTASGIEGGQAGAASALVIEDFGTRGLTGSWQDDADTGPFRSFWFRHGRSFKGGSRADAGGSANWCFRCPPACAATLA